MKAMRPSEQECYQMAVFCMVFFAICSAAVVIHPTGWEGLSFAAMGGLFIGLAVGFRGIGRMRRFWNDYYGRDLWSVK